MQRFTFRLIWGSVAGAFVAGVIFGLAQYLIRGEPVLSSTGIEPPVISVMSKKDIPARERVREERPKPPEPQELAEKPKHTISEQVTQPAVPELMAVNFQVPKINTLNTGPGMPGVPGIIGVPGGQGDLNGMDGDVLPIVMVEPSYPPAAARRGQEGEVTAEFTVRPDGSVTDIVIIDAKPRGVFEQAARRSLAKWKFKPRQLNGKAIASRARQTITFSLDK